MVVCSNDSDDAAQSVVDGVYKFGYELIQPLEFDEPHYVRLVHFVARVPNTFVVCCDFVKSLTNNGEYTRAF